MTSSTQIRRRRRQFSVDEYHRMAEAGVFAEDDRLELIEGEIVEMTPVGSRHVGVVMCLQRLLHGRLDRRFHVSTQNPLRLGEDSEPEPDLVVLRDRDDGYLEALPRAEDARLVIEVAETSLEYDRQTKVPLYARHDVPVVWLVNLEDEYVECYERPDGEAYQERRVAAGSDLLELPESDGEALTPEEIFG